MTFEMRRLIAREILDRHSAHSLCSETVSDFKSCNISAAFAQKDGVNIRAGLREIGGNGKSEG